LRVDGNISAKLMKSYLIFTADSSVFLGGFL